MSEVQVYAMGLCHASVCVPAGLERDEVEALVNLYEPSGTELGWTVSEDEAFATGQKNPCPCEQTPGRQHYLMDC